ncbi:MAG: HU family DNA-binding protein [Pseudomonadota bacterium]
MVNGVQGSSGRFACFFTKCCPIALKLRLHTVNHAENEENTKSRSLTMATKAPTAKPSKQTARKSAKTSRSKRTVTPKLKPEATPPQAAAKPASQEAQKSKPVARTPIKVVPNTVAPDASGQAVLKKKDLIDAVVGRSGLKRHEAKAATEALLAILGETLAEGKDAQLPPLGKVKVARTKDVTRARVMVCRIRQPLGKSSGKLGDVKNSKPTLAGLNADD